MYILAIFTKKRSVMENHSLKRSCILGNFFPKKVWVEPGASPAPEENLWRGLEGHWGKKEKRWLGVGSRSSRVSLSSQTKV